MMAPGTAYDDPALGKDPQGGHMDDYVETTDDNGGVHLNSGIPNRAFALAATGDRRAVVGGRGRDLVRRADRRAGRCAHRLRRVRGGDRRGRRRARRRRPEGLGDGRGDAGQHLGRLRAGRGRRDRHGIGRGVGDGPAGEPGAGGAGAAYRRLRRAQRRRRGRPRGRRPAARSARWWSASTSSVVRAEPPQPDMYVYDFDLLGVARRRARAAPHLRAAPPRRPGAGQGRGRPAGRADGVGLSPARRQPTRGVSRARGRARPRRAAWCTGRAELRVGLVDEQLQLGAAEDDPAGAGVPQLVDHADDIRREESSTLPCTSSS